MPLFDIFIEEDQSLVLDLVVEVAAQLERAVGSEDDAVQRQPQSVAHPQHDDQRDQLADRIQPPVHVRRLFELGHDRVSSARGTAT
jgi:hypothetical protein